MKLRVKNVSGLPAVLNLYRAFDIVEVKAFLQLHIAFLLLKDPRYLPLPTVNCPLLAAGIDVIYAEEIPVTAFVRKVFDGCTRLAYDFDLGKSFVTR